MRRALAALLLFAVTAQAVADDINMLGAGKVTCKEWATLRASNDYFSAGNWLLGFLSGTAWDSGKDLLSAQQTEELFVFVDNYCIAQDKDNISNAAVALAYHLLGTNRSEYE